MKAVLCALAMLVAAHGAAWRACWLEYQLRQNSSKPGVCATLGAPAPYSKSFLVAPGLWLNLEN